MSKNDLNIDDLAARPKDIDAATAEKITGGQLSNNAAPTAPITSAPYPTSGPAGTVTHTTGVGGAATTKN